METKKSKKKWQEIDINDGSIVEEYIGHDAKAVAKRIAKQKMKDDEETAQVHLYIRNPKTRIIRDYTIQKLKYDEKRYFDKDDFNKYYCIEYTTPKNIEALKRKMKFDKELELYIIDEKDKKRYFNSDYEEVITTMYKKDALTNKGERIYDLMPDNVIGSEYEYLFI